MTAKLSSVIEESINQLTQADVADPEMNVRFLIIHALGINDEALSLQVDRSLTLEEENSIRTLVARRSRRETFSRIIGESEFWGLRFGLNEATLEPRPDSETLVQVTLNHILKSKFRFLPFWCAKLVVNTKVHILDLGTGTGCLLLSLLHELPAATGVGVDIAPRAIEQAQKNAEKLGLKDRASFKVGDWLEVVNEKFDIIISNPPYIAHSEIPNLIKAVRDHDPDLALDGGHDGLDPYRFLIPKLPDVLKPKGLAVFEVGFNQASEVSLMMRENGFTDVTVTNDLNGIGRCVSGSNASEM